MSIFTGFEDNAPHNSFGTTSQIDVDTQAPLQWTFPHTTTTLDAVDRIHGNGRVVQLDSTVTQPVTARIDEVLHGVVDDLLAGNMPALAFVDTPFSSRGTTSDRNGSKRLPFSKQDTKATDRFCRAMIIIDAVQENKLEEINQTQRDLYYHVKSELFPTPLAVANSVKDVSSILGAPREDLNITTFSGKGKVAGSLKIYHPKTGQWQDCSQSVFAIPGDLKEIRSLQLSVLCTHALVIEKEAVFGSLVEARIWQQFPMVLITGSGMPDIATRAMLKHICASASDHPQRSKATASLYSRQAAPQSLPPFHCMGLVDWNPAGCDILLNYKFGNKKGCRESQAVAVPELLWMGVHQDMLSEDCDAADMQRLTALDQRRLQLLLGDQGESRAVPPSWKEELVRMQRSGKKCEIEAAYRLRGINEFCRMLVHRISMHIAL